MRAREAWNSDLRNKTQNTNLNRVEKEHSGETRFDLQLPARDSKCFNRHTCERANCKAKRFRIRIHSVSFVLAMENRNWSLNSEREREGAALLFCDLENERSVIWFYLFSLNSHKNSVFGKLEMTRHNTRRCDGPIRCE